MIYIAPISLKNQGAKRVH